MTTIETQDMTALAWHQPDKWIVKHRYSYRDCGVRTIKTGPAKLEGVAVLEGVSIRVEVTGTDALPLRHKHEFAFVQRAWIYEGDPSKRMGADLRCQNYVEHCVDGVMVDRFGFGHSSCDLYGMVEIVQGYTSRHYGTGLVGSRILRHDAPCCGGEMIVIREHIGYSTLQECRCSQCGARWEIGDGHHFERIQR